MLERLRGLMAASDELGTLKMDIVRALTAFNGVLWESELYDDIVKVRGEEPPYAPDPDLVDRALRELEGEGIVAVEERTRSTVFGSRTYRDRLVRLRDPAAAKEALWEDPVFRAYMARKAEFYRRFAGP